MNSKSIYIKEKNTEICEKLTVNNAVEEITTYRKQWKDHVANDSKKL
jgi:hypothetical protein